MRVLLLSDLLRASLTCTELLTVESWPLRLQIIDFVGRLNADTYAGDVIALYTRIYVAGS